MLVNLRWCMRFYETFVCCLAPLKSDHTFLWQLISNKRRRPFRFLSFWLTHENCLKFLRWWNKEVFSGILRWKRILLHLHNKITYRQSRYDNPCPWEAQE
ncbi:hypothetical protein CR513_58965, partial [Mucuna pruriens]